MHGHVLAADDRIAGEPVAIVLLRSVGRGIAPFDGHTIGRGVATRKRFDRHPQRSLKKKEKICDSIEIKEKRKEKKLAYRFAGVQTTVGRIDFDAIGSDGALEMETDTSNAAVGQFDANFEELVEGSVVVELVERDRFDVAGSRHCFSNGKIEF